MTAAAMTTRTTRRTAAADAARALTQAAAAELAITSTLHASGALFNIPQDNRSDNGPVMSGSIREDGGLSVPVSVFLEKDEDSGEIKYCSLSIGGKDKTHFYGKLFRTTNEPGNGPMYSGFIVVLPVDQKDQYTEEQWEKAPRLQVCGWRRRSADGSARISLSIAPKFVQENELAF